MMLRTCDLTRNHIVACYDPAMSGRQVEQHVDVEGDTAEVWRSISDRHELASWFGGAVEVDIRPGEAGTIVDDEGTRYDVLVTDVEEGRRVAWHWWDERGQLSSVEISLEPVGERTRVRVVERLVGPEIAPATASACERRRERATTRLWTRVSAHAHAW